MELKRLKHLVALADTRNFGRAAAQCHLTQPAFSRSIKAAETELGLLLFDRGTTEASCTDAGRLVVERARKLLFDSRCLDRDVSLYRERLIGDLALGVGPFPAATMLPQLLTELRNRFPGVRARVEVNNSKYLAEHLQAEELDFFVADIRMVPASPDLTIRNIGRQTASFYVRRGHPLLDKRHVKAAAILPHGLASVRVPAPVQKLMAGLMGLDPLQPFPLAVECDDIAVLKTIAMTTDTVMACPDSAAGIEVAKGQLKRLTLSDVPMIGADMGVVSLSGRSFSPIAQFAVNYLAAFGAKPPKSK